VEAAPGALSDPPGPVVVVVVDVVVVVTQFLLLSPTLAQSGAAPTETAEIAIAAANMAATVRSTSIRFTLIHPPFLHSFFPTKSRIDPIVLPLCGPHLLYHPTPTAKNRLTALAGEDVAGCATGSARFLSAHLSSGLLSLYIVGFPCFFSS
jgi:hypothetical protein